MVNMEEQTAILFLRQGDLRGLEALVKSYQVLAVHAAQLIVRERSLAEDVVQSAFLRLPEIIHKFDDTRPFKPWFMRIVVNDALKALRGNRRLAELKDVLDDDPRQMAAWLIDDADLPEEQVITAQTRQIVRKALESLSPEQRAVIVMRYFLDMRGDEMAQELDRPLTTVKWWLHDAKQQLRSLLRKVG